MHDAGIGILQNLLLQKHFRENDLDSFLDVVQTHFRLTHRLPHLPAAVNAIGKDGERNGRESEEDDLKRRQGDVPENLATFTTYEKFMFFH